MDHAKAPGIEKQRQLIKPGEKLAQLIGIRIELLQGFLQLPTMARRMRAYITVADISPRRMPAQGVELVITHQAMGLPGLDHAMHEMQGLTNPRAAIDDVAEKQRHPPRMTPDPGVQAIAQAVEQVLQAMGTAMHVTNQVVATVRVEVHYSAPPSRLPQPSLVRQAS